MHDIVAKIILCCTLAGESLLQEYEEKKTCFFFLFPGADLQFGYQCTWLTLFW